MKALVYEGVETLTTREVADPIPEGDEVLVRVRASGICGSDMHAYLGHDERRPAPLILGHEASGLIASGPQSGTHVTINPLVTCQTCAACLSGRTNLCANRQIISMMPRQGAFADYVVLPMRNLIVVPNHVSFQQAALAEPLACGWHTVRLTFENAPLPPEQTACMVLGGGAIGFGAALALRAFGTDNITLIEPHATRRENLTKYCDFNLVADGINAGIRPNSMDVVIDGVGYEQTRATACTFVKPGGTIAHIGLGSGAGGLDIRRMTLQEIRFIGTYTYTMADFHATTRALFDGHLGDLDWSEQRQFDEGSAAFRDLHAARVTAPKIILNL